MAQVTIYKDPGITIVPIDGPPPIDQSALVATLQGKIDAVRVIAEAKKAADAAAVDGQDILDATA